MNILIAADMEGIAGIDDYRACLPSHPAAYARGRRLMTDEVLAAIEALRAGGVERIAVGDWHMVGTNIERERIPAGIEVRPIADLALDETEPSMAKANGAPLDGVVMLGHHAQTKNPRAFCSHTFIWEMEVTLGGEPLSEARVYAQALAAEAVPVLVASGDRWMLEELGENELGGARLVTAMEGLGRARSRSREVETVRAEIATAIESALAERDLRPPPPRGYPAELTIAVEGEELARTEVRDPDHLLTAIADVFRTSQVSREYRQLAKLLPAGDTRARALQRRLGSLIATPVMRSKERKWLAAAP